MNNIWNTVHEAIKLAINAHDKQQDKLKNPYIFHPLRVMNRFFGKPEHMIVAILHDTIEDCDIKETDLLAIGLPTKCIEAIVLLTRTDDIKYKDYINNICNSGNRLAIEVKIADMADNSSFERCLDSELDYGKEKGIQALDRYRESFNKLRDALRKLDGNN